jgi:hypothetical protein
MWYDTGKMWHTVLVKYVLFHAYCDPFLIQRSFESFTCLVDKDIEILRAYSSGGPLYTVHCDVLFHTPHWRSFIYTLRSYIP